MEKRSEIQELAAEIKELQSQAAWFMAMNLKLSAQDLIEELREKQAKLVRMMLEDRNTVVVAIPRTVCNCPKCAAQKPNRNSLCVITTKSAGQFILNMN